MNNFFPKNSIDSQSTSGSRLPIAEALAAACPQLQELGLLFGRVLVKIRDCVTDAATQAEEEYERGLTLGALRCRHRWKASDVARARALPRTRLSEKRLSRLMNAPTRGRPVVRTHQSLPHLLINNLQAAQALFGPGTLPRNRIKLLKQTRFWPYFAEALYRGCYLETKAEKIPGPSVEAEARAGNLLTISPATLRKLCGPIRRERDSDGEPIWPALSPEQFKRWSQTGDFPDPT
jgi:hypothetical protein